MLTAIITGAASGVGLATTKLFLLRGYRVLAIDRDRKAISANLQPLRGQYTISILELDLCSDDAASEIQVHIKEAVADASSVLVFSIAGQAHPKEFKDDLLSDLNVFKDNVNNNLFSHFVLVSSLFETFRSLTCKKSILLISSINSVVSAHLPSYSAAKSGLRGLAVSLSRSLRTEMETSINVCLLGTIKPEPDGKKEPKDMWALDQSTFRGTVLTNDEVANFLAWLADAPLEFTGNEVVFDAGQTINLVKYN